jgi:DNA-binding SARP family transcriptional activator/tetratricopeptide (TPR) repeat protein
VRVEIGLLGGFTVSIDGVPVPEDRWRHRPGATLVKLLALTPGARLHRDRVLDALWPDVDPAAALPRLHKAAHFARQATGSRDAVVLREEVVALFPHATVEVDVAAFDAAADTALNGSSPEASTAAIALFRGELLPDDLTEPWLDEHRSRVAGRRERLLRRAHRWHELLGLDPADEQAHVALLRDAVATGDRAAALRRFDEMERVLRARNLRPGPEAVDLRDRALAAPRPPAQHAPSETLMERDEHLAVLERAVRSMLRTGRGAVVLLTGEAGSGKSALTRAFLRRVDDELVVAVGGCDDLLAPRGLAPFRDMAEGLPDLAAALSGDVFPALLRFVAARPTAVVIEDVHWADDVTLDAIRYLSRRITDVPAILLLTFRSEDIDVAHPLRGILGGLPSSYLRRLELPPLSVEAVRRLAGVDDTEAAEIHRITQGNPFFVTEVLDAGGDSVPATVRDAVLARVGRLPPAARRLAEHLAVVPTRAERWLAEDLAGEDPDALVQAERAGVISGGPEHVAFRHELARRAIETSLTPGELVQANREVLNALLRQARPEPSRIVHHAEWALRGDVLARYGPVAADQAQRVGAHRQAAETVRVVLERADEMDPATRARLLTQRAYSLYVVNEYDAALTAAESAVSLAESAEGLIVLSRIAYFARGPMTARAAARRAVDLLEGRNDEVRLAEGLIELARTYSNLGTLGIVAQRSDETVRHADRALTLAERLHRDDLRAQALCYRGSGRLAMGDPRGNDDLERAIAMAAASATPETAVRTYVNAAGCAYRAGRFADADGYVAEGLRLAADGEFASGRYRLRLTSAAVYASRGAWDQAIVQLRDLVSGPGTPGVMAVLARSLLARLLARRGDPECGQVLSAAVRDAGGSGDSYVAGPLAVAQLEVNWLTGSGVPATVWKAMELAAATGHTAILGELCVYLRRFGDDVAESADVGGPWAAALAQRWRDGAGPADIPGPWAAALAGRWRDAAAAWEALGERYEQAVELVSAADDETARAGGLAMLGDLGASATVRALIRVVS